MTVRNSASTHGWTPPAENRREPPTEKTSIAAEPRTTAVTVTSPEAFGSASSATANERTLSVPASGKAPTTDSMVASSESASQNTWSTIASETVLSTAATKRRPAMSSQRDGPDVGA
ncbi:hypothetical protein ACRAWB_05470 [Leifsonia poae]|uniref:hypothetical protein n=1 Tax=Leifsonia poae TaxID=110933 RepID=UPI003D694DED